MNIDEKRAYDRNYYHTKVDKKRKLNLTNQRRARVRSMLDDYLSNKSCVDCGITDRRVFEFDHVAGIKELEISNAMRHGWSWERLLKEIAKCEIRCANCHRIRHYSSD